MCLSQDTHIITLAGGGREGEEDRGREGGRGRGRGEGGGEGGQWKHHTSPVNNNRA